MQIHLFNLSFTSNTSENALTISPHIEDLPSVTFESFFPSMQPQERSNKDPRYILFRYTNLLSSMISRTNKLFQSFKASKQNL